MAGCGDVDGEELLLRTGTVGWAPSNLVSNCCDPFALPIILRWFLAAGNTINSSSHYTTLRTKFTDSPKHEKGNKHCDCAAQNFFKHQKNFGGNRRTERAHERLSEAFFSDWWAADFFMTIFVLKFFFFLLFSLFVSFAEPHVQPVSLRSALRRRRRRRVFSPSSVRPPTPSSSSKFASPETPHCSLDYSPTTLRAETPIKYDDQKARALHIDDAVSTKKKF